MSLLGINTVQHGIWVGGETTPNNWTSCRDLKNAPIKEARHINSSTGNVLGVLWRWDLFQNLDQDLEDMKLEEFLIKPVQ